MARRRASVEKIVGARTFDSFLYVARTDTTKTIQVERCTALAAFLAPSRDPDAGNYSPLIRDANAPICIDSRTPIRQNDEFFNHPQKTGTQNAVSADVREPEGRGHRSAVSLSRRSCSEFGAEADGERDLYDTVAASDFEKRNRKPKGAKPWQFPVRRTVRTQHGMRCGRRVTSSSPCRSSCRRKGSRHFCRR